MKDLLRLPCLLLALLLALPAVQAGGHPADVAPAAVHEMAMHDMAGHDMAGHDAPAGLPDHKAPAHAPAVHHDCIGCIAPLDIAVYRPARAPRLLPGPSDGLIATPFLLSGALAPEPPPPRLLV